MSNVAIRIISDNPDAELDAHLNDIQSSLHGVHRELDGIADLVDLHAGRIEGFAPSSGELGEDVLVKLRAAVRELRFTESCVREVMRAKLRTRAADAPTFDSLAAEAAE